MLTRKACYTEQPGAVLYMPLPDGSADVWLRKNINQVPFLSETDHTLTLLRWEAEEAYMRFPAPPLSETEIEADFDSYYETAAAWEPDHTAAKPKTAAERIARLEDENKRLRDHLDSVMEAVDHILMEV